MSPLNSSFNRISKTLSGISLCSRLSHRRLRKWEKSLKEATVIPNQAATFNRYINKVHEDMQEHIKSLYSDSLSKGKSSQKTEKVLTKLRNLSAFQQNVIFLWENPCSTWQTPYLLKLLISPCSVAIHNWNISNQGSNWTHGLPLEISPLNIQLSSLTW